VVVAEVLVGDVAGEHVPGGDEDGVASGDRRLLVAAAAAQPLVLGGEVGALGAAGGFGRLTEPGAQPLGAVAGVAGLVLARGLVVAGAHPGPGGEVARGRKAGHVGSD